MIIRPIRLNASHRNRRRARYQWRSRRSEMQFMRYLALTYGTLRQSNIHQSWREWRWRLCNSSVKIPANPSESQQ